MAWGDLDDTPSYGDGIVACDDSLIAAGENSIEMSGSGFPGGGRVPRCMAEPGAVAGEEARQEGLSVLGRANVLEGELGGEAVLEGAPHPLNAALGFRGAGTHVTDPELIEDLPELRGSLASLELFIKGPVSVVPNGDVRAVAVEGFGNTPGEDQIAQGGGPSMHVFVGAEAAAQRDARRIIDRADEGVRRAIGAEPLEGTPIDEDEGSRSGSPLPTGVIASGTAAMLGRQPEAPADLAHGFGTHWGTALRKEIANMAVIQSGFPPQEPLDRVEELRRQSPRRSSPSVAVDERHGAALPKPLPEPLELAQAQSSSLRTLGIGDLLCLRGFHQAQPPGRSDAHLDSVHRGTESLWS